MIDFNNLGSSIFATGIGVTLLAKIKEIWRKFYYEKQIHANLHCKQQKAENHTAVNKTFKKF